MRIVSFLPSATEMVCALGLGDQLVGITHECDYPAEVRSKPVVVRSAIEMKGLTSQQVDEAVSRMMKAGQSLYVVDETVLKKLAPDLIVTQDLCQVCAPSGNEVGRVVKFLSAPPKILWMTPKSLAEIFENIRELGEATGRTDAASDLLRDLNARVETISRKAAGLPRRPRVFCMEWLSPPYNAGHWMPELVERAGGIDALAQKGKDSTRVAWEEILDYDPEVLVLSPCGFNLEEVLRQVALLTRYPEWERLSAVREGRVYAVDANSYFARPGPRVVDGLALLAALIHPEEFDWPGPSDAYRPLDLEHLRRVSVGA
ncbi:MAG: cobalamin-binding protein [Nitrospirae bacterium]|nr:cobalamin-binding protein [Candidatus Manganitrophaceae bacterium]